MNVVTRLRNVSMDVAKCASGGRLVKTCGAAELKARDAVSVSVLGLASRFFPDNHSVLGGL